MARHTVASPKGFALMQKVPQNREAAPRGSFVADSESNLGFVSFFDIYSFA